jgi:hypothetical protein
MFPQARTSTLAQRALGALRLTRSFLLLEDDYDVDWEVDPNEHSRAPHPHRVPLRGRIRDRRPGAVAMREQVCLTPVGDVARDAPGGSPTRGHTQPRRPATRLPWTNA